MSELLAVSKPERLVRVTRVTGRDLEVLKAAIEEDRPANAITAGRDIGVIPMSFDRAAKAYCARTGRRFERDAKFQLSIDSRGWYFLECDGAIDDC